MTDCNVVDASDRKTDDSDNKVIDSNGKAGDADSIVYGYLQRAEVGRCAFLEGLLFPGDDPWSAGAFRSELQQSGTKYLAVRRMFDGELLGYAGLARLGRPGDCEYEIRTIGVDPNYQGRGIGRELLGRLLSGTEDSPVFLEVRTDNIPAITLYKDVGFQCVGIRKRYYQQSGADAYTMRRAPIHSAE